jgi:hypothetical protein
MLARFKRIRPSAGLWRKAGMAGFVAGVAALAFFWGRHGATRVTAQAPDGIRGDPVGSAANPDYQKRVVAFVHGNVPITREDLGEYLIARYGAQRVEFLVNRRIIEMACRTAGISVSDSEVDAQLRQDIAGFGIPADQFVNHVLKRYGKSLFEWREDVIRPKLALTKFCKSYRQKELEVTQADLQMAFEAHYGEKVECRMLVLNAELGKLATEIWQKVSRSDEEFNKQASQQFIPQLASTGGKIPPIHKHFSDPAIEKAAFALTTPGEVSNLLEMPDKTFVILKLVRRIPPETGHNLENERLTLHKEMAEYKLAQEIPKMFAELKARARPNILLQREQSAAEQDRQVRELIRDVPGSPKGDNGLTRKNP